MQVGCRFNREPDIALALAFGKSEAAIKPDFQLLTLEQTKKIQESGFKSIPMDGQIYGNDRMKTYKVDGIISDFPDRL
jgi:glycerophosphoryl diester phosphodiesterase